MTDTDAAGGPPSTDRPQTSTRDHEVLAQRLSEWLGARPGFTQGVVHDLAAPSTNGMSSETLLFDAEWTDAEGGHRDRCVARLEPEMTAVPVFPSYDLELQYRVMNLVGERTGVPVPRTLWFEPERDAVGSPFIVMGRVDGVVPPDVMPYPFGDNWLFDAHPDDQRRLQDRSVAVLADLHSLEATEEELSFLDTKAPGDTPLRRHVNGQRAFYDWTRGAGTPDEIRLPVL
ncbi:MAG TPA: phosphotransferase family protein, partial [Acidimicrobiales bacterium]|nr:phosphotransferase family protein [Acidimicrobiales bacterium]